MQRSTAIPSASSDSVSGLIERVTFHSEDTGFCVLRIKRDGERRGSSELVTVVGTMASVSPGEWLVAEGVWVRDKEHGLQLKATLLKATPPTSLEGIEKYLGSGMIKGIGPHFAKKLVAKFGEGIFDVIEHESKKLEQVEGIGSGRRERIKAAWEEQKVVRAIMVFLHSNGISTSKAVRIHRLYGEKAIDLIRANPYRLAQDVPGIGFSTADAIAQKLGIPVDSIVRAVAAVTHALSEATGEGHCALPEPMLRDHALKLLEHGGHTIPATALDEALRRLLDSGELHPETIGEHDLLFLPALRNAEIAIAEKLRVLARAKPNYPPIDVKRALAWVENTTGRQLAAAQREALALACSHRLLIITGGPGVGKTTLVNSILQVLRAKKVKCVLAAPTGRAAKRLTETTGVTASTLHRLLEVKPGGGFQRGPGSPLEGDLFVVDETSMVDVQLMAALCRALPRHASLILVGDVDQLPSVGPGLVLHDLIASRTLPVVRLTEVFRQASSSRIITSSHAINRGQMPDLASADPAMDDFFFIERDTPERIIATVVELACRRVPARLKGAASRDLAVLTPMNRGSLGTSELNAALQAALNPARPGEALVRRFAWEYRLRDKVMQIRNNYDKEVFNGDIGRIAAIDNDEGILTIHFEGRDVAYEFADLDELVPAYAITIHKSQGSEFPAVILPIATQHFVLLQRNLLYTGITRGKKLVVVVGQKKALGMAIRNHDTKRRFSGLLSRLTA